MIVNYEVLDPIDALVSKAWERIISTGIFGTISDALGNKYVPLTLGRVKMIVEVFGGCLEASKDSSRTDFCVSKSNNSDCVFKIEYPIFKNNNNDITFDGDYAEKLPSDCDNDTEIEIAICIEKLIFGVLHELGHVLLNADEWSNLPNDWFRESGSLSIEDYRADLFAQCFYLPKEAFAFFAERHSDNGEYNVAAIAKDIGISRLGAWRVARRGAELKIWGLR